MKAFPQGELRFDEKSLQDDLSKAKVIFVGSSCDMFAEDIPEEWILKTLGYCSRFEGVKFLFQSKNPKRIYNLREYLPKSAIIGTTIETNRCYPAMGSAPYVTERARYMKKIKELGFETMVTIEPIIAFDLDGLTELIKIADPDWVNIGADSKKSDLEEPTKKELQELLKSLKDLVEVKEKSNLGRLK